MGLIYALLAGLCAAVVNFCLRKNLEQQRKPHGYLSVYFVFSLLLALFFKESGIKFSLPLFTLGSIAGVLNFTMMLLLARCIKTGPSGLTFAFQNTATMLPSLLLFMLFGRSYGFEMTVTAVIGFILIGSGLFLSARRESQASNTSALEGKTFSQWAILVFAIFLIQGLILTLFQWRTLLLQMPEIPHRLIPWNFSPEEDVFFLPGFFFLPALLQIFTFVSSEKRWVSRRESVLGLIGGLLNGTATFLLLLATKVATPNQKIVLFPFFAMTVILICSLWGKQLYQEKIYWPGLILCLVGILISSL